MRLSGATVAELIEMLSGRGIGRGGTAQYLAVAFGNTTPRMAMFLALDPATSGEPSPEALEQNIGRLIDARVATWTAAPFPELMRVRDYFAFLEFAKEHGCVVNVCGANPWAGAFIGRAGFRCYDGRTFVVSRDVPPFAGAIAADPDDPRLRAGLAKYAVPLTYEGYLGLLRTEGLHVLGPDQGFVVQDAEGSRLYEPYRLHGVYERATNSQAWRGGGGGERLRAALNRCLGSELVRFGPHDDWMYRNDREVAGPSWGPQPPMIEFTPDGDIENYLTVEAMAKSSEYARRWSQLYPQHPVNGGGVTS
jgi:hypothetical protein